MTIFIYKFQEAFCRAKSRLPRALLVCLAGGFALVGTPAAYATRFPTSKDRAQGDSLYQQAFAAYQAADYAKAQGLIEKADEFKPDQPDGWNLRGMVYLKQNAFDKAETAFARAVALDPKLWAAQFNLAEAPFQGKDYARARGRFEKLVGQTDRFKEAKQWELVQFKAFFCCLLMGDEDAAMKKMAKLPSSGSVTPAYLYAQAALSFNHRDQAAARKSLTAAQTTFTPLLNDLFSNSLVEAGWVSPLPPTVLDNSAVAYAPVPKSSSLGDNHTPVVIDPKLEAAVADPLPSPDPGARLLPPKMVPAMPQPSRKPLASITPAPSLKPTPLPDVESEHRGLLLE